LEVRFFKYLNLEKPKAKTKDALKTLVHDTLELLGMDTDDTEYYYLLYLHNYRPDGDYENITTKELVSPREFKPKKTTNTNSRQFVKSKIPFQGSNLKGEWRTDNENVPYYVVISYGWYPVFLFKENKWYEVSDSYSSSTGKQMNRANPVHWNDEISERTIIVSRDEMRKLEKGLTYDELIQLKKETLVGKKSDITSRKRNVSFGWWDAENSGKVKFKINDVSMDGNKVNLDVEILEVGKRDGQKMVPLGYDYTEDRTPTFSKKNIERIVYNYIVRKYRELVSARAVYNDEENISDIPDNLIFKISFKHKN
jgi:hypothetical protein